MDKEYLPSYRTYLNDRLNKVGFHSDSTYPLYVRVTLNRKSIFFKSYYFSLLAKEKYRYLIGAEVKAPTLRDVEDFDKEILEFLIIKMQSDFTLEKFKTDYDFLCKDLCDELEPAFCDYLFTFFNDEGMPSLGAAIAKSNVTNAYDLIKDMKLVFSPKTYKKLIDNSVHYAPPYLPLCAFMLKTKRWPIFSVREWLDTETRNKFLVFFEEQYPGGDKDILVKQIDALVLAINVTLAQRY